jgi:thioredoxin-like negative regulator of GroEL
MDRAPRVRVLALTLVVGLALPSVSRAIDFAPSLAAARESGDPAKPVVVTFSAPWCGWCRKLATTTFPDPQVAAVAEQYLWVKLDPDEAPELAARLKVHGLPHTVLLDAEDRVLGSQPGYMTPAALVQFLAESRANPHPLDDLPQPLLEQLATLDQTEDPAAVVTQAIELLSQSDRDDRAELLAAIEAAGPAAQPHLVALLSDDRLALRAAAAGTLQKLTRSGLPFDPFAAPDIRAAQADDWARWIENPSPPDA